VFDHLSRELRNLEGGVRVPIELALDDEHYLDRACPNPECGAAFKVLFDDWREKVPDDRAYCPICGFIAEASAWNTPEQQEQIKSAALRHLHNQLNEAFARGTQAFNRSQPRGGLIRMSMSYRPGRLPAVVTAEASEVMTQRSTCEACGCRYSSVGAAFFCPVCGHTSAASAFHATVEIVRKTLAALPKIRRDLTGSLGKDGAEDSVRQINENALVKLVGVFQHLAEALYEALPNQAKPRARRNVFQNLTESSELWRSTIGHGYDDMISASELSALERFFQQRHLLVHNDGIVDQLYLDRSGDLSYSVGQRLVVRCDRVAALADLIDKLAVQLHGLMPRA
jgi:uncharacterized Zn finger protein (UPF0148 family)